MPSAVMMTPMNEQIGRNEPCPCGSGKKFKRCCGVDAAPKLSQPAQGSTMNDLQSQMGFDPSQLDPQWMGQFTKMFQRLPKGQLQRLQALMQKAMHGKNVSREMAELEKTLPPEFQQFMKAAMSMGGGLGGLGAAAPAPVAAEPAKDMSVDQAMKVVEDAFKAGKITREQRDELLQNAQK